MQKKVTSIIKLLEQKSNPVKAQNVQKYMKDIMPFRGVTLSDLNEIVKEQWKCDLKDYEFEDIEKLAILMIQQKHGEDKWVGTHFLGRIVKQMKQENIQKYQNLFNEDHIKGWAAVDNFCSKVLQKWIKDDLDKVKYMRQWADSDNLWVRRASCVGLLHLGKTCEKEILDILFEICQKNIFHQERFNQLGCGWLLRYMSINDLDRTIEFIKENKQFFTSEGLRYAYEKMKKQDIEMLRECRNDYKQETKEFERKLKSKKLLN